MKLWYNDVSLHAIGTIALMSEDVEYTPTDAAQKRIVKLTFRVDVWLSSFTDNRAKMVEVITALKTQHGVVKVTQPTIPSQPTSSEVILYNQTGHIVSHNFPSDVNEWGTSHQQIRITFELAKHDLTTNAITANFGTGPFELGTVHRWKEQLRARRYDSRRDIRDQVEGEITASGEFLGNMSQALATRRVALGVMKEQFIEALNKKSGQLTYLNFDKTVRVSDLSVDIDQAVEKLTWNFTATYTRFPNEEGYAGAEFEVNDRKDSESGELFRVISGRIVSESEVRAHAKLDAIRSALMVSGWTTGKQTRKEHKSKNVSQQSYVAGQDSDGDAFIELTFTEEYRRRDDEHLSWNLDVDDQEDDNGFITRTYSGSVTCGFESGSAPGSLSEADTAFIIAYNKAKELAANKYDFKVSSSIKRADRQTTSTATQEMVKVDFSWVYKLRGSRLRMEVKAETQTNTFGDDIETVSGMIVGTDTAGMTTEVTALRALYSTKILRNDSRTISDQRVMTGTDNGLTPATELGPSSTMSFQSSGTKATLTHRMDFSFQVHKPKTTGSYVLRYNFKVGYDYTRLVKTVSIGGSMFGDSALIIAARDREAGNVLDAFLTALSLGTVNQSEREVESEFVPTVTAAPGLALRLTFNETFTSRITGDNTVIECEVTEEIQFSGDRNVVIPVMAQAPQIQRCGKTEARRTITGTVTAANETAGLLWVKGMREMPVRPTQVGLTSWGPLNMADTTTVYTEPPRISIQNVFVPMTDGQVRGSDANKAPNCVRISFTFVWIITTYDYAL